MLEQEIQVGIGHTGADNRIKPGAIADILQNASWFQMDTEKVLVDWLQKNNCGMYMVSRHVIIKRFPVYGEKLTIKAWICGCNGRFGYRNTVAYDQKSECCFVSHAIGAYIDLEIGKAIKIPQDIIDQVMKEPAFEIETLSRKVEIPQTGALSFDPVRIYNHHLDYFGHMNNARYVDIATDCLPSDFSFNQMRIEHKRPIHHGEYVFPELYSIQPEKSTVALRNMKQEIAAVLEFSMLQSIAI